MTVKSLAPQPSSSIELVLEVYALLSTMLSRAFTLKTRSFPCSFTATIIVKLPTTKSLPRTLHHTSVAALSRSPHPQ